VLAHGGARCALTNGPHILVLQTKPRGFIATGAMIVRRETPLALYKGLGAVLSGIVPKMAIRFASFETYKGWLADRETGQTSVGNIFLCALFSRRRAGTSYLFSSLLSWPWCGRYRGSLGSEPYGGCQDPSAGTDAFFGRPARNTAIS
jgi:hypothetical protein